MTNVRLRCILVVICAFGIPLSTGIWWCNDKDGAYPELHFSRSAVHLVSETLDVVERIDDQDLVNRHLALHRSEDGTSGWLLGARLFVGDKLWCWSRGRVHTIVDRSRKIEQVVGDYFDSESRTFRSDLLL